jgi:hypothetical protein
MDAPMEFVLTITFLNGGGGVESHDLESMRDQLVSLARMLDSVAPGEKIVVERIS